MKMKMSNREFKIWMIENGYSQDSLAKKLEIHPQTITTYNTKGYPVIFVLALKGITAERLDS